jgi:hypothetical protein
VTQDEGQPGFDRHPESSFAFTRTLLFTFGASSLLAGCTDSAGAPCSVPGACAPQGAPDAASVPTPGVPLGRCGDGVVDVDEACDDGAACADGRECTDDRYRCDGASTASCLPRAGDGCGAECRVEPGYACNGRDAASGARACQPIALAPPGEKAPQAPSEPEAPAALADAGTLAPSDCPLGEFGEPQAIVDVAPDLDIWSPALSTDAQTLYFAASPPGASETIYRAQRSADDAFDAATPLANLATPGGEGTPFASADQLTLYFYSLRPGGDRDLWIASRGALTSEFDEPRPLPGVNGFALDHLPWLSSDERTLIFVSSRAGGLGQSDLWTTTRAAIDAPFEPPVPLPGVNTPLDEGRASLTADRLAIIFSSARDGTLGDHDLWIATRSSPEAPFGAPTNLGVLNSTTRDIDPFLATNERELFFVSTRTGRSQLLRAVRCAGQ